MDNEMTPSFWGRGKQRHVHSFGEGCWDAVDAPSISSFAVYQYENRNCSFKMWIGLASALAHRAGDRMSSILSG